MHKLENTNNNQENPHYKPYYLGMFLVGSYQEIMGNLHNLFGDINVVHLANEDYNYQLQYIVKGDNVANVLEYVEYKADELQERLRRLTESALMENKLTIEQSQLLLKNYDHNLRSYTYLQ